MQLISTMLLIHITDKLNVYIMFYEFCIELNCIVL